MLFSSAYLLLSLAIIVKTDEFSEAKWIDLQDSVILVPITEYCQNKTCIVKCCRDGQIMSRRNRIEVTCVDLRVNYSTFNKYIQNHSSGEVQFVQNEILSDFNQTVMLIDPEIYILKDGSLKSPRYNLNSLEYCIDFYYDKVKSSPVLAVRIVQDLYDHHAKRKELYFSSALMVSLLLSLLLTLVYAMLPRLQHLTGMMFTTTLMSLIVGFIIKFVTFTYTTLDITLGDIASLSVYYILLSSFCWLSLSPFHLWWTLRESRRRPRFGRVHRRLYRHERLKMLWLCLYGWGIPALVTLSNAIIDKRSLFNNVSYIPLIESYAYGLILKQLWLLQSQIFSKSMFITLLSLGISSGVAILLFITRHTSDYLIPNQAVCTMATRVLMNILLLTTYILQMNTPRHRRSDHMFISKLFVLGGNRTHENPGYLAKEPGLLTKGQTLR